MAAMPGGLCHFRGAVSATAAPVMAAQLAGSFAGLGWHLGPEGVLGASREAGLTRTPPSSPSPAAHRTTTRAIKLSTCQIRGLAGLQPPLPGKHAHKHLLLTPPIRQHSVPPGDDYLASWRATKPPTRSPG